MKAQLVLLVILFLGLAPIAQAQKFDVPENYQFNDKSDFEKYEPDFLKAVDWFERTPYNEQRLKRREVANFIMDWIEGCPYVVVETSDDINELGANNNDLLIMYLAGYAKYVLQSHMLGAETSARMAGMKALLAKYQKDKAFIKDKHVERLAKLDQQGELGAWLAEELNTQNTDKQSIFGQENL